MKLNERFISLYQFRNYPVFVAFEDAEMEKMTHPTLVEMKFIIVDKQKNWDQLVKNVEGARILKITRASVKVEAQIEKLSVENSYQGLEVMRSQYYYQVYTYAYKAMMVLSYGSLFWELGLVEHQISKLNNRKEVMRTVLNRFLSLALIKFEVQLFWGIAVSEGVVLMSNQQSAGEAVYFDVKKQLVLSSESDLALNSQLLIMRLDQHRNMGREELYCFLKVRNCFILQQMIHSPELTKGIEFIAKNCHGVYIPEDSYQPKLQVEAS
jgi:hypothetical protein